MALMGLCILCETEMFLFGERRTIEPDHCYGTGDNVTPGLIGGFVCSCDCRNWPKPDQPRFRPAVSDTRQRYHGVPIGPLDRDVP